ncbi:MAG: type I glutamate--ammonia ligase [Candidatus Njordarchaeales archaeon]
MLRAQEVAKDFPDVFRYDVWITDLTGHLRIFSIKRLEPYHLEEGIGFDGSSVPYFGEVNSSDFIAKPDISTLRVYPWLIDGKKVAFAIADIYEGFTLRRSPRDPRFVAQRLEDDLKRRGLKALVSAEVEFFLYEKDSKDFNSFLPIERKSGLIYAKNGYFQSPPIDQLYEYRTKLMETLEKLGLEPHKDHHEVAGGQMEINIKADSPVRMSDKIQILKFAARKVADQIKLLATFMPKPVSDDNGSGMHIHLSLWRGDKNLFYDEGDEYAELSDIARYFIGGILEHAEALAAIIAPTVNSYKRLVPDYEAPVYICWGRKNRSAMIRIPLYYRRGSRQNAHRARIEIRAPDPMANPYLAIPALIYCGLDGIDRKISPGDPIDENVYHLPREARIELGIRELPRDLREALEYLESDTFLRKVLGSELIDAYLEYKKEEWRAFMKTITPWEYERYFFA